MKTVIKNDPSLVFEIRQGIEREGLRVDLDGHMSMASHPKALGSKLTHPQITTDYSENLLEFITGVHQGTKSLQEELEAIQKYTLNSMGQEFIWPNSMPAILPSDENEIPLAYYGKSNVGQLKTLYRRGLGHRYGRSMQSIAGVHYNFSLTDKFWSHLKEIEESSEELQEFKNRKYFHLIRNFQRYKWVLIYLFSNSTVVHGSFLKGKNHSLKKINEEDFITPKGMSLRMGGLGYTSSAQESISICYNKLSTYLKSLEEARLKSYPAYEKIGMRDDQGHLKQLNTHILQIDNEFYSNIRPKNVAKTRESALKALHFRGVEYLEVRLLDVDPFHPLGISKEQIYFLHTFLLWCLDQDSPQIEGNECRLIEENFHLIVTEGRDAKLELTHLKNQKKVSRNTYLNEIFSELENYSRSFAMVDPFYSVAFDEQQRKVDNPESLPAQKVLDGVHSKGFIRWNLENAERFTDSLVLSESAKKVLDQTSEESLLVEEGIRKQDKLAFEEFLKVYFEDIKIDFGS